MVRVCLCITGVIAFGVWFCVLTDDICESVQAVELVTGERMQALMISAALA